MSHPLQIEIHILLKVHQVCSEYWYSTVHGGGSKVSGFTCLAIIFCSITLFVGELLSGLLLYHPLRWVQGVQHTPLC